MHQKAVFTLAGVLLVAGAGTGTTLAAWHDQRPADLGVVRSGSLGLTVNGSTAADLGTLTALPAGSTYTVSATLTSTAPGTAKHLRTAVYVDGVRLGGSVSAQALGLALVAVPLAGGCPAATGAGRSPGSYSGDALLDGTGAPLELAPQQSARLCVTLLPTGAGVPPGGESAPLTLTLSGRQVAP